MMLRAYEESKCGVTHREYATVVNYFELFVLKAPEVGVLLRFQYIQRR